jgi:hypothetical protein
MTTNYLNRKEILDHHLKYGTGFMPVFSSMKKDTEVNEKNFEILILKNYSLTREWCRMKSIQTQVCLFIN